MEKNISEWEKINAELISMFNYHISIIQQQIQEQPELCPIVAFLDNGQIKSYVRRIKDPNDFPKMQEIYKLVKGVKDSTNIFGVMIAYTMKQGAIISVIFELEHREGDCLKIIVPTISSGVFRRKLSLAPTKDYKIETLNKIVWID